MIEWCVLNKVKKSAEANSVKSSKQHSATSTHVEKAKYQKPLCITERRNMKRLDVPAGGTWLAVSEQGASLNSSSPSSVSMNVPSTTWEAWAAYDGIFDLSATPIIEFDVNVDQVPPNANFGVVDVAGGGWNNGYQQLTNLVAGQTVHEVIDMRTFGIPLNYIGRIYFHFQPQNWFTMNATVTNITFHSATNGGGGLPSGGAWLAVSSDNMASISSSSNNSATMNIPPSTWEAWAAYDGRFDLTATPIIDFDVNISQIPAESYFGIIDVGAAGTGWTAGYQPLANLVGGQTVHYQIDMRTLPVSVPLNNIGRIYFHFGSHNIQTTVSVTNIALSAGGPPPAQLQVSVSPSSATISVSEELTLTASPAGGTPPYTVDWRVGNEPPPVGGALHVHGGVIHDKDENVVILRGIGEWGFCPDFQSMFGVGQYGYTGNQWGATTDDMIRQHLNCLKNVWGVKVIRCFYYPEWFLQTNITPAQKSSWYAGDNTNFNVRTWMQHLCALASEYGMFVSFVPYSVTPWTGSFDADPYADENVAPNGYQGMPMIDLHGQAANYMASLGYSADAGASELSFWDMFWTEVGNTFKSVDNAIIELWNEPESQAVNQVPSGFLQFANSCYSKVRATGATNIIVLQWYMGTYPNGWGANLDYCRQFTEYITSQTGVPNNLAFSTHWYGHSPTNLFDSAHPGYGWHTDHATVLAECTALKNTMGVTAPLLVNEAGSCMYYSSNPSEDYAWWESLNYAAEQLGIGITAYYWGGDVTKGGNISADEGLLAGEGRWVSGNSPEPNTMGLYFRNYARFRLGGKTFATTFTFSSPTVGDFPITATATDSASKTASATANVTVTESPTPLQISVSPPTVTTVPSGSVLLTAAPFGGTAPYTVTWKVNGIDAGTGTTYPFSTTVPGEYTITATVTDAMGNVALTTAHVTVALLPTPSLPWAILFVALGGGVTAFYVADKYRKKRRR